MQVPLVTLVTKIPDTVQTPGVAEVNDTGSVDVARADKPIPLPVKSEGFFGPGLGKSITCSPGSTVKEALTLGAAR